MLQKGFSPLGVISIEHSILSATQNHPSAGAVLVNNVSCSARLVTRQQKELNLHRHYYTDKPLIIVSLNKTGALV